MPKGLRLLAWLSLACGTSAVVIALSYFQTGKRLGFDSLCALGLLFINWLFFVAAAWMPRKGGVWGSPALGMLLVVTKLFVNTFTIFLFIGLQAVRSAVFVPQFFSAYLLLLAGSVYLLNRNP